MTVSSFSEITKTKPEKRLVKTKKKTGGRNSNGRITARGIGGGHKQKIRNVDFKRNKHGMAAEVIAIEYEKGYRMGKRVLRAARVVVAGPGSTGTMAEPNSGGEEPTPSEN